ncbi:response regulator [Actinomycetaceae bacterium WB03_NA08]|uniref:Response regulator n=1 Tax=Scrofimicrobium canadense TaxID=2652290 RepID=A0A6N7W9M8_9ACTO|nr:response regulator [Scrofimicrobium canadense]MSS84848.1 response regulator [Scrofimicrobium canadense]
MSEETVSVLLYSDDANRRNAVIEGVGKRPAKDVPPITWLEAATAEGAVIVFEEQKPEILVLDAESYKVGGMAVAKELQNEHDATQPVVLLTARPQDNWLAKWAGAVEIVGDPLDPLELQEALARVIRGLR